MSKTQLEGQTCPLCNVGHLQPGTRTMTMERDDAIAIIKEVPGLVCDCCGEGYSDEETTARVLDIATSAFDRRAEVEIVAYQAPGLPESMDGTFP